MPAIISRRQSLSPECNDTHVMTSPAESYNHHRHENSASLSPATSEGFTSSGILNSSLRSNCNDNDSSDESLREERRRSPKSPETPKSDPAPSPPVSKCPSRPPNVTVVQPSATHAMFPFMYPSSGLFSTSSSIPFPLGHMFFNSASSHMPFASQLPFFSATTGQNDLNSLTSPHPLSLALNSMSSQAHNLLQPAYSTGNSPLGGSGNMSPPSHMDRSSLGPIFPSRTNTSPRFTPYSLPSTKTTMSTSTSPVAATGLSLREISSESVTSISPRINGSSSATSNRSPISLNIPHAFDSNNHELRSMERMLSGLERHRLFGLSTSEK